MWAGQLSRYSDWLQAGRSAHRNPGVGEIFRTCPDRPWGQSSLLYNGYRDFPGRKERPGRDADYSPPSIAVVKKGQSYTSTPSIGRTACTEPQCLYKGALHFYHFLPEMDECTVFLKQHKTKLRGLSPRANYSDRAAAAGRRSQCQLLKLEGCHVVSATDPHGRFNLCFLDRSRYIFIQVIDLTRLSGPRSRPTTTQKVWQRRESNRRPLYLQPETLTTRPERRSLPFITTLIQNTPLGRFRKTKRLSLNGTRVSDINLLGKDVTTIKKMQKLCVTYWCGSQSRS